MTDMLDLASDAYQPRPLLGCTTDEELLSKLFAPNKESWVNAGQWFVEVTGGVQDGAVHTGTDFSDPVSYLNPDGSDGNGNFPKGG
jgi:hypothetical protein